MLLSIILAYFALLLGIAFYTSRHANNESFFIGNRKSNWLLVSFGMIGTSLSGMTFISVPGMVGGAGMQYFMVAVGYWIGYFLVAFVLLPVYYKMNLTSIYTYLEARLGISAHKTGALFFILSRTLGATLRLYLVIKVLEFFVLDELGISFTWTAILILALIVLYTLRGGVKTIVWTDTLQTTFMLAALLICACYMLNEMNLSTGELWQSMSARGLSKMAELDVNKPGFFLKQILGGAFITVAMTGLDQEMMQKNISVSNVKDARKNMLLFGFVQMVVVFIFLILGAMLYLYAEQKGITAKGDDLFPTIAVKSGLPFFITVIFLIGLVSALFPSADGALTALTACFCIDILNIKRRADLDDNAQKQIRYRVHFVFSFVFLLCIFFFRAIDNGSLIDILLKVAGFTYGPLLGLFAFGLLTKRVLKEGRAMIICLCALPIIFLIDLVNNAERYFKASDSALGMQLKTLSKDIFGDYKIGIELLIINALITFLLLRIFSRKATQTHTADTTVSAAIL